MALTIAGLGPGGSGLLTGDTLKAFESGAPVVLRTRHHPTVGELDPGGRWADCDDLYAGGQSFEAVYGAIVERVLGMARVGDVVYAVPGHPLVAERSVVALLEGARAEGLEVRVLPAVSYVDVAAVALGMDLGTVQLCDALDLHIDAQQGALISQVYDRDSATALKLRLLEVYSADHRVTVLHAAGGLDEEVSEVALADLDHRAFSYLDSVYVPALEPLEDVRRFDGLHYVVSRLHAEDGCPWDREQTHESLRPYLLEEAYEALDAIDADDPEKLAEEMGDVLLQVLMHAAVGERSGEFTLGDVTEHIARKLVRRHPHVFGEGTAATAEEVSKNWDALKKAERPEGSILDGVPSALPALAASQSLQGRARRLGFNWPAIEGPLEKLREEIDEFARAEGAGEREEEFGDVLFTLANVAERLGIDSEQALRVANAKFRRRFSGVERLAREDGVELSKLDLAGLDALWERVKAGERG